MGGKNVKKAKRNIIIVTVLFFVCAAVYLNWSYNHSWGRADEAMVEAEDAAMAAAKAEAPRRRRHLTTSPRPG